MKTHADYINDIVSRISQLDPCKIVLFGSHASENNKVESDIDLLIVLDSDIISQTYEEKMKKKLEVRNQIMDINKHVPIDLIVYTKAEYDIIEKNNTSFLNEIKKTGKTLYEKAC